MEPVPLLETGMTVAGGQVLPVLRLDATHRPDVADLARVHEVEGVGDVTTYLAPHPDGLAVTVACEVPVRCTFSVVVPDDSLAVLEHAAQVGLLVLATSAPDPDGGQNPSWLAVDVDQTSLRLAIAELGGR